MTCGRFWRTQRIIRGPLSDPFSAAKSFTHEHCLQGTPPLGVDARKDELMRTVHLSNPKDLDRLRRIALDSQADRSRPIWQRRHRRDQGNRAPKLHTAGQHFGYRTCPQPHLRSRVPDFTPDQSNKLLEGGQVFEYWAHAAAYLPINEYRYYLGDKSAVKAERCEGVHQRSQADGASAQAYCR